MPKAVPDSVHSDKLHLINTLQFPRLYRLLNKTEFTYVFDKPLKINQKHLLALFKTNQKSHARLGLVVGKRVAKSAAARNRIKRVIRESFRHIQPKLKGVDIIVIARLHCDTLDKAKLREGIDKLWEKLQVQSHTLLP